MTNDIRRLQNHCQYRLVSVLCCAAVSRALAHMLLIYCLFMERRLAAEKTRGEVTNQMRWAGGISVARRGSGQRNSAKGYFMQLGDGALIFRNSQKSPIKIQIPITGACATPSPRKRRALTHQFGQPAYLIETKPMSNPALLIIHVLSMSSQ